ncbi:MAG: redoxin domain-containing protein [Pseudomonadota bacterium]
MLTPRKPVPALAAPTVAHGDFDLATESSDRGVVVCFYRGLHCPICANYLTELEKQTPAFADRGVSTLGVSADDAERGSAMAEKIGAKARAFASDRP